MVVVFCVVVLGGRVVVVLALVVLVLVELVEVVSETGDPHPQALRQNDSMKSGASSHCPPCAHMSQSLVVYILLQAEGKTCNPV